MGVELNGAFVSGVLDIEGCKSDLALVAFGCKFGAQPVFRDAALGQLILGGSVLPGLNAHRVVIE